MATTDQLREKNNFKKVEDEYNRELKKTKFVDGYDTHIKASIELGKLKKNLKQWRASKGSSDALVEKIMMNMKKIIYLLKQR